MATVNKDFRIKSGLVVEGANGTINGSNIITEATLPGFVTGEDIITEGSITGGTQTGITVTYTDGNVNFVADPLSAEAVQDLVGEAISTGLTYDDANDTISVDRTVVDNWYDASGSAATAEANANDYTDQQIAQLEVGLPESTDQLPEGVNNLYFTEERAQDAFGNLLINSTQSGISVTYDDVSGNVDFDVNDPTITISGDVEGSATMTNLGNVEIAVTLDNVNTAIGTFGSSTEIPSITVDAKGRVTLVQTNSISTDLNIAGDTGTDIVTSGDTLTFTGGDGITTAVTDNNVGFDVNVGTGLEIGVAGDVQIDSTVATLSGTQTLTNKTLGSGTVLSANLDADGYKISNLGTPVLATDAANKEYVDSVAQGLDIKESVRVATGSDIPNLADVVNTNSFDGVTVVAGDRVLVKSQTDASQNGIYIVTQENNGGAFVVLERAADADEPAELNAGTFVFVEEGTVNGDTGWVVSSDNPLVIGTDAMVWTQFSGAGTYIAGSNLDLTGNQFSLQDEITLTTVNADLVGDVAGNVVGNLAGNVVSTAGISIQSVGDAVSITAAKGISLSSADGTVLESDTYVGNSSTSNNLVATQGHVASELDSYLNSTSGSEGTTILYVQDYVATAIETGDATATPTYLALDINSVAKQVAATVTSTGSGMDTVYQFDGAVYRSAKFLVKIASGTHTQVSEVLLTLDTSNNVAITEYAIVGTNGSLGDVTATYGVIDVITNGVSLIVNSASTGAEITVMGTLLV